jgi:UPF0755 protein
MGLARSFFFNLGKIGLYAVPFMLGGLVVFIFYFLNFVAPLEKGSKSIVYYAIPSNATFESIAKELEEKNLIRNWWSIYFLSKLQGSDSAPRKIIAGEYELSPGMTPKQILDELLSGNLVVHQVKIPQGATLIEIAGLIQNIDLAPREAIEKAFRSPQLMSKLSVPAYIPEGYIIPGDYSFSRPITPEKIVFQLVEEGMKRLETEQPNWTARSAELGYRPYEILILASLIEKEAPRDADKGKLSSLYHNRLQLGMPLESEAALTYTAPFASLALRAVNKETPNPYNTFLAKGLPQTPICSPSAASLKAALFPDDTEDLYFLKQQNGSLVFAPTSKQFEALAAKLLPAGGVDSIEVDELEVAKTVSTEDLEQILGRD